MSPGSGRRIQWRRWALPIAVLLFVQPIVVYLTATRVMDAWPALSRGWSRVLLIDLPGYGSAILVAALLGRWTSGAGVAATIRRMGFANLDRRQLYLGGFGGLAMAVSWVIQYWAEDARIQLTAAPLLVTSFIAVVAISEESVFRGFVFRELRRGRTLWAAVIFSSVIFSVSHSIAVWNLLHEPERWRWMLVGLQLAAPFLAGLPLAWLYERGGCSLWGCVLAHLGGNANNLIEVSYPHAVWGMSVHGAVAGALLRPVLLMLVFALLMPRARQARRRRA